MKNFKKARRALGVGALAITCAAGGMASKAQATTNVYLVGAASYVPLDGDGDGSNHFTYYHRTTNSTDSGISIVPTAMNITGTSPVTTTQSSAISFPLALGDNTFTLSTSIAEGLSPGEGSGVMFFFNDTGTSYNPTNPAGPSHPIAGIPGDLDVYASAGSSSFHIPTAGTEVLDYLGNSNAADHAPPHYQAPYSGATSFTVDTFFHITVTAFTAGSNSTSSPTPDTFTLHVEATPEPASLGLLGIGSMVLLRRRR